MTQIVESMQDATVVRISGGFSANIDKLIGPTIDNA